MAKWSKTSITENLSNMTLINEDKNPSRYKIIFVTSRICEPMIIFGEEIDWLTNDMIGSCRLEDILETKEMNELKALSLEHGLYSAELVIQSYQSNNWDDPIEWDMNIWLEDIKKIELKYD